MAEYRHVEGKPEFEIRAKADGKDGEFTIMGYAAVFNSMSEDLGGFQEVIRPGAFDRTLKEIAAGRVPDVSCRVQHAGGLTTIGRTSNGTLRLSVDANGLRYECDTPNTNAGRDIVTLIKRGDINKSSFAFSVGENGQEWNCESDPQTRILTDLDLYDVAPVDGPAYEAATVQMRAAGIAEMEQAKAAHVAAISGDEKKGLTNVEYLYSISHEMKEAMKKHRPDIVK